MMPVKSLTRKSETATVKVALAGCPNVGKTSLFNALTGTKQYVANWPGVTVEKKEGSFTHRGYRINLVDLPGTYSLGYSSIDEKIARDYILKGDADLVVVVADSVNPEQSLYLLLEILEMEKKVILVLTAIDEARKLGIKIDRYELQKHLGVPVVFTSAVTGEGIEKLKDRIVEYHEENDVFHRIVIKYEEKVESKISQIESVLRGKKIGVNPRYFALKYLSGDPEFYNEGVKLGLPELSEEERIAYRLLISKKKREYIESIVKEAYSNAKGKPLSLSEAIDHVLTHKFLAFPLFFALMYLVFKFTFDIAQVFADLLDLAFSHLGSFVIATFGENAITSLIADGIVGGVGSVLVFVPNIFAMFLALGFLEESGYLPRAAFVMDRIMEKFKLSGRAFMSLILGFGCNVPSIMATRSIDDPKERLVTILIAPFMSCSARLPVYLLILRIFFPKSSAAMLFLIYSLSILVTLLSSVFINWLFYRGRTSPLIMELPRYRMPTFRNLYIYTWNRGKHFLRKAGTIIFVSAVLIWVLSYFPAGGDVEKSFSAMIGKSLEWIFKPFGYSWKVVTSLFYGAVAKEVIVSTMAMLYGFEEETLLGAKEALSLEMDPVTSIAFLVFVMAYIPCLATIATIYSETGSLKCTLFSIGYSLTVAYVLSLIVLYAGKMVVMLA